MSNDNEDVKVFKNNGKISIPHQLSEFEGARFIIIDKSVGKGKKPKERKWTTEKNYSATEAKLLGHIRGGGNYGVATGISWLHCLDIDEVERVKELGILEKLPKTLTVLTGGEGLHYWYEIEGLQKRIIFYDTVLKDQDNEDEYLHLGEVQSRGNYAIGPNCVHASGKRYKIIDNSPIAKLSYQTLMEILSPLRTKKKDDRPSAPMRLGEGKHAHCEVELSKIAWPRGTVNELKGSNGREYRGENPFHGSKHGQNFSVNPGKGVWHCFRHGSGGGWVELLAVKEGIISCDQAGHGCLSKAQYREVMQRAEDLGLLDEKAIDAPIKEIELDREVVKTIPRQIPNGDMVVLIAPPRTGKTHAVVQWLRDNGTGNYITHTHAIVEHAIKIARELEMTGVVWVVGMSQPGACRQTETGNCSKCPLKHTNENHMQYERKSASLLHEQKLLTVKNIPLDLCPYYTLKAAEKHARYCFTVVNNINNIIPRKLTILDEEPVLSHFYATSIEVGTIKTRAGETATKNYITKSTPLQIELDNILNQKKKPAMKEYAKKIQEISKIFDAGVDEGWKVGQIADEIEDVLIGFAPKHREMAAEGEQEDGDNLTMDACVRCLGNIYREEGKSPVNIVNKPGGYQSIYILGDERKTSYGMDWLNKTDRVIIIGATKAEIFANEFGGREIVIEQFRYDERFMLIGVHKDKITDDRGSKTADKKKVLDIGKAIWRNSETVERTPIVILTGSKKEQEKVASLLNGATMARKEREGGMEAEFVSGKPVIIFQNSVISRGLDVDQYNVLLVYGCDFAQPFWSIADAGIAAAIISDETTNSVLRISSTLRTDNKSLKIVVMSKEDLGRVKYLTDKRVMTADANDIAKVIRKMGVGGSVIRDGRAGTRVIKTGVNYIEGKEKFIELISNSNDIIDDEMVESMKAKILSFFKEQKRAHVKIITIKKINAAIGNGKYNGIIKEAINRLYYMGILIKNGNSKESKWELNTKSDNNRQN